MECELRPPSQTPVQWKNFEALPGDIQYKELGQRSGEATGGRQGHDGKDKEQTQEEEAVVDKDKR